MATIDDLLSGPPVTEDINNAYYINPVMRTIEVPSDERVLGTEGDQRGECKYFRMPKVVGNSVDVAACSLRIYFINADGQAGYYDVKQLVEHTECIVFCWELSKRVTAKAGTVQFSVCVEKADDAKVWNTTYASGVVLPGIPYVPQDVPDDVEVAETKPVASEDTRGKWLIVPDGTTDRLYICLRVNGVYDWVEFKGNSSSSTTSILGKATLGTMILQ